MPDESRYPAPNVYLRHAAGLGSPAPSPRSPSAVFDSGRRGSGNVDVGDLTTGDLALFEAQRELKAAQARIRALEGTLHCVANVVKPYTGGNGR